MAGLVSTAMPSKATFSSTYSMPFAAHVSASSSLIGRLASEMSVSPSQKTANPSPVPGPLTVTCTAEPASSASSATFSETGCTVDEPEMFTEPSTSVMAPPSPPPVVSSISSVVASSAVVVSPVSSDASSSSSSPHAAATSAKAASTARGRSRRRNRFFTDEALLGRGSGGNGRRSLVDQRATYETPMTPGRAPGEHEVNGPPTTPARPEPDHPGQLVPVSSTSTATGWGAGRSNPSALAQASAKASRSAAGGWVAWR